MAASELTKTLHKDTNISTVCQKNFFIAPDVAIFTSVHVRIIASADFYSPPPAAISCNARSSASSAGTAMSGRVP